METLKTLARHEEITLYCDVAIMNLGGDPVDALWGIAQHAEGWGKIEAVKQLAPLVGERPDVKRWLVTDGCANGVMDESLGHVCATAGELASALAGDVDEALVDGASTIVSALCGAEPGEDMHDYDDAPFVVERVLDLLQDRCTMDRLDAVIDLKFWLEEDHPPVRTSCLPRSPSHARGGRR